MNKLMSNSSSAADLLTNRVATKERILRAALEAFALDGFAGVSMRRILANAGVNAAAGHYHFGSKQALYDAVVLRHMLPLNDARITSLKKLENSVGDGDRHVQLAQIIRVYIEPHVDYAVSSSEGKFYNMLIVRFLVESEAMTQHIYHEAIHPLRQHFSKRLIRCFPNLTLEKADRCFRLMALVMGGEVAESFNSLNDVRLREGKIREIVTFIEGGLQALISLETN